MSRWGKNIVLPLDSLIKEKENTNRPTAARSAGTVGKWGKMGFTSTRTYALQSLSMAISPGQSPDIGTSGDPDSSPTTSEPVKPKKFFKSRNAPVDLALLRATQLVQQNLTADQSVSPIREPSNTYTEKRDHIKIKIPKATTADKKKRPSLESPQKAVKKKTKLDKKVKPETTPSRATSRHRKVINYNEDDDDELHSRIGSGRRQPAEPVDTEPTLELPPPPPAVTPSRPKSPDHPPIVLRISKGTSRLISTDSEDQQQFNSPQHEEVSHREENSELADNNDIPVTSASAAYDCEEEVNYSAVKISTDKPPKERLKLIIKTDVLRNSLAAKKETKKKKKCTASPSPGLICESDKEQAPPVTPPVSEKDFDSQSSVLGSNSTKSMQIPPHIAEESCVIRSRGSSDITSDLETSQHSSLVAPPSDIELRLESMMDGEDANDQQTDSLMNRVEEPLEEDILKVLTGDAGTEVEEVTEEVEEGVLSPKRRTTRRTINVTPPPNESNEKKTKRSTQKTKIVEEPVTTRSGRVTRNCNVNKKDTESTSTTETAAAGGRVNTRKRKIKAEEVPKEQPRADPVLTSEIEEKSDNHNVTEPVELEEQPREYKIKNRFKRAWMERDAREQEEAAAARAQANPSVDDARDEVPITAVAGPVKLVISKKKGSIFKSRAVTDQAEAVSKKRHVYKHTWDADEENSVKSKTPDSAPTTSQRPPEANYDVFNDVDEDDDTPISKIIPKLTRVTKVNNTKFEPEAVTSVKCDRKAKEYYTVVRNVKTAHQIQEIGEFQEMDDDIEYILDALQPHNPMPTRCLSALQLASKCMTPAFRMHVRAHGTVTKFFRALRDSKSDISLGLCTATIMFVLSHDALNMDVDKDSLELMVKLLDNDMSNSVDVANFDRSKAKVRELCEEIKSQGKATYLSVDAISPSTLAMETLLSLSSKRAGDWFKEELRELGGLEHIINTVCECCRQITDYVVSWSEELLDKLRIIERCLRVLENVSYVNEKNQHFILYYQNGNAVDTLFKLYKLCDSEIALYPTTELTPKDNPGVVLREALVPTLKVLINLTHAFDSNALGSALLGQRVGIFDTSLHILLQAPNYIPERCVFELSLLVLLLLINLTMYTTPNRTCIMESNAPQDFGSQYEKVPAIKALIEYFYKCEKFAQLAEQNTDDLLDKNDSNKKQDEVDERVNNILQKAGHHMEHTFKGSYTGILIGNLIKDNEDNEIIIRSYLPSQNFADIITMLQKYYNFIMLTASSEATVVSHMKATNKILDLFKQLDAAEVTTKQNVEDNISPSTSAPTRSTPRVYKTYSQR